MVNPSTITNLPAATTPLSGGEFAPIVQNGVTVRITTGQLILPGQLNSVAAGNGIAVSQAAGVATVSLAALPSAEILVGNASNVATPVAISGDATLSNAGALTLDSVNSNVGSFTNASVTVNAKGLVTAASSGTTTVPYAVISGCLPSAITGNNTTASMTVSSGQVSDSTNVTFIISSGYLWEASNGNAINGTDAISSILADSTTYHMFLCSGNSGTGTFASASLAPTFPTGYSTYKRRIFSFNTDASGTPIPYTAIETEGGSLLAWLTTQLLDVSVSNLGSSARVLYTLTVPTGIKVQPLGRVLLGNSADVILTSGDETDVAVSSPQSTSPAWDIGANSTYAVGTYTGYLTTNTSGQIGARANTTSVDFNWITRGFKDFRRN